MLNLLTAFVAIKQRQIHLSRVMCDSSMALTPCSPQFSIRQPNSRPPPLSKVRRPQRLACSLQPLKSGSALPAIFTASSPLHLCLHGTHGSIIYLGILGTTEDSILVLDASKPI